MGCFEDLILKCTLRMVQLVGGVYKFYRTTREPVKADCKSTDSTAANSAAFSNRLLVACPITPPCELIDMCSLHGPSRGVGNDVCINGMLVNTSWKEVGLEEGTKEPQWSRKADEGDGTLTE